MAKSSAAKSRAKRDYNRLGITVNYLFYPRAGIGSESFQKAVNVWCAPDRKVAMTMAKAGKTLPKKNCSNFVTMDYNLGQKAGVDGRLFGSVTNHDVSEELNKQGYKVVKSQVRMPNGPIKLVGDSTVGVALHTDVVVEINVTVYGESA